MAGPLAEVASRAPWLPDGFDVSDFPVEDDPAFRYCKGEIPLPSAALRATVSGPELGPWLHIGSAWASVCSRYIDPDSAGFVLDIGCGVGKAARFLQLNPRINYCGFDIFRPAIEWCRRAFAPVTGPRFRFEHFDGRSAMYNPAGTMSSTEYSFPAAAGSVDVALAASVFTHLYEQDMRHYFYETRRVLKPRGVAIVSFYLFEDLPRFFPDAAVDSGAGFYGNEQMMFVRRERVLRMSGSLGLAVKDDLGPLCGQQTFVFTRA